MESDTKLRALLENSVNEAKETLSFLSSEKAQSFLKDVSLLLAAAFHRGNKVLIAGNGGSICDAAHFAEELTGNFRKRRKALPAIVLSEPGHVTCVGNDFGFDQIFARGVEAFGQKGDVFIALTTSGNSKNILLAVEEAHKRGMVVVSLLGKGGGALAGKSDYECIVPQATNSDRIQEVHMTALHIIIEGLEFVMGYN